MSFPSRPPPGHLRQGSMGHPSAQSTGQSPALVARIAEKKAELDNLKELQELSAAVAGQMEALETKLSTLSDGTEAIATVVGNWHNVLRAINMASAKIPRPSPSTEHGPSQPASEEPTVPLPQTLVRIPTEHAPNLQAQADDAMESQNNSAIS